MVGNIPNYSNIDILRAILYLSKPVSRQELVKRLGLGEGTVRTILDILKDKKLISSTKKGHFLSDKGRKVINKLRDYIISTRKIVSKKLYPEHKKAAVLLRNIKNTKINVGVRDIAVKNGADGALILLYKNGLKFPNIEYNVDFSEIEKNFKLINNDVLVIGFATNSRDAENGALAIAASLCKKIAEVY